MEGVSGTVPMEAVVEAMGAVQEAAVAAALREALRVVEAGASRQPTYLKQVGREEALVIAQSMRRRLEALTRVSRAPLVPPGVTMRPRSGSVVVEAAAI
jgi:hypothetical protein